MDIKPMYPPKNRILEGFNNILIEKISEEERDVKLFDYYRKNSFYFENINDISSNTRIVDFIKIKFIYIRILDSKAEYVEANKTCEEIDVLLRKLNKDNQKYLELFKQYLLWKGIILAKIYKYKDSSKFFKKLLDLGDINQRNKNWYVYSLRSVFNRYIDIILIIVFIIYMIDLGIFFFLKSTHFISLKIILLVCLFYLIKAYTEKKIIMYFVNKKYKTNETI